VSKAADPLKILANADTMKVLGVQRPLLQVRNLQHFHSQDTEHILDREMNNKLSGTRLFNATTQAYRISIKTLLNKQHHMTSLDWTLIAQM